MTDIAGESPRRRSRRHADPPSPAPAGNMATGLLKLIALVFMFVDHSGKVLFNDMVEMRTLGRIAFPLYIWCMIVGFYRTRNVSRYMIRVMLTGLVSQPLYYLALDYQGHLGALIDKTLLPFSGGFSFPALWEVLYTVFMAKPNIFLTLLMGLVALCAIREKDWLRKVWIPGCFLMLMTALALIHDKKLDPVWQKLSAPFAAGFSISAVWEAVVIFFWKTPNYFSLLLLAASLLWKISGKDRRMGQVWGPAVLIILATVLKADYGWKGVLFFIMIYAVQNTRTGLAAVIVSYLLFWGSSYSITASLFGEKIKLNLLPDSLASPVRSLLRSETYAIASLPLILIRFPRDLRLPKWLSYLLYPGHLIILIVLKIFIFGWAG